jgi:hypothetical protein
MFRRLASFAEKKPESAAKVILVLAVAFLVAVVGVLAAVLDEGDLSEPPYPSETTPMSWEGDSVVWTETWTVVLRDGVVVADAIGIADPADLYAEYGGYGRNYSSLVFLFSYDWSSGSTSTSGDLVNDSHQHELSVGSEVTVDLGVIYGQISGDGDRIEYSLEITDMQGNGAFDEGDQIAIKPSSSATTSFREDAVYTFALVYLDGLTLYVGGYSFAFHDGEFYTWKDSDLNWDQPWWEP